MTIRTLLLFVSPAAVLLAAQPTDYSAEMVMLQGNQVMQTLKLNVSGMKSRVEGFTAGPFGKIVSISRKDRGVTWTLYLDTNQYTETSLAASSKSGKADLSNLDLANVKKENLGKETVLGYACTKMRVTMGSLPNGQPLVSTVWVADRLETPIRLEAMGITQENRNLTVAPQAASLFEIPAGFAKTSTPGMAAGGAKSTVAAKGREAGTAAGSAAGATAGTLASQLTDRLGAAASNRIGGATIGGTQKEASAESAPATAAQTAVASAKPATATNAQSAASSAGTAWKLNTNRMGGDYRTIDMATSDPTACKAACDKDGPCKAWTLVKLDRPGGMGYCWLKDSVPPESADDCCISGLKGGSPTSKYQLEQKVNRNGSDYRDFLPASADAVVCAEACAKESRCKSWTWVNAELEGPTGHCWLKHSVPDPDKDDCCVSGVKK